MSGVTVNFSASGGGSISTSSSVTGSDGFASVGGWVLGPTAGPNSLTASAVGGANPTAQIAATARNPRWTFMIYMAADNNLATSGIGDIDEMEASGANPEVQVFVQAEFNRTSFGQAGITPASVHLPNYNTVRFAFGGSIPLAATVKGPNNVVTDIGNRDMTDPTQLAEFIQSGKANFPAERYAVVLWNHGGGYQGLLADETSAPNRLMKLAQLRAALAGVGTIDVLDFDMCLMGGYETLHAVEGSAKVAVFSEASEPGDGDPYTPILQSLYANPTMDAASFGSKFVDYYDAYYASNRSSTTKSAYDLTGLPSFENALNAVAQTLTANATALATNVAFAAFVSQKYEFPMFKDVADLMDSITVRVSDATLKAQLSSVRAAATSSTFRLGSRAHQGSDRYATSVTRSSGLTVVLPSGASADDWFRPTGQDLSLADYQVAMPGKPWAQFLASYVARLSAPTVSYVDLGADRWETYLVWDSAAVSKGADLDIWVLEPNGNLYIPFLGTVTPNGVLSSDSNKDRTYYEGYLMNRFAQSGRYRFYASLFNDPADFRPAFDIAYRRGFSAGFASLYSPNFPRLSKQRSWLSDSSPTFAKVEAGSYTDLAYAAFLDISAAPVASLSPLNSTFVTPVRAQQVSSAGAHVAGPGVFRVSNAAAAQVLEPKSEAKSLIGASAAKDVNITEQQLRTVRANWAQRTNQRFGAPAANRPLSMLKTPSAILEVGAKIHRKPTEAER